MEAVENASVSFCSNSGMFFACFVNNGISPSRTISCEASLESNEMIIDKEDVTSSSVFDDVILDTSRYFPPRITPSSINSFTLTNIVSGIIDHIPGFEICISPERWESATSFGNTFVSKCSANTF